MAILEFQGAHRRGGTGRRRRRPPPCRWRPWPGCPGTGSSPAATPPAAPPAPTAANGIVLVNTVFAGCIEAARAVPMKNSGCSADTESAHECLALSADNHAGGTRPHHPSPPQQPQQPMAIAINTGTRSRAHVPLGPCYPYWSLGRNVHSRTETCFRHGHEALRQRSPIETPA